MNLDEFINESLKSIIKGVKKSQEFAKENNGRINPIRMQGRNGLDNGMNVYFGQEENARPLTLIDFDIAVTTSSQKEKGIDGGIKVLSLSIGGKDATKVENLTVSRIKFSIGVALPHELT